MTTTLETAIAQARVPIVIGAYKFKLMPHRVRGVGPRIFVALSVNDVLRETINLSADDARLLAMRLIIAACEAEAQARRDSVRAHHQPPSRGSE